MRSPRRAVALGLALLLVASACGSKLSARELAVADSLGGGSGRAAGPTTAGATADTVAPTDGGAVAADPGATGGTAPGASGSTGATATGSGTTTGGAAATTTLPPGGNGGATDVGVTASSITIGTVASLTGPIPGLFRGAVLGTQACAARTNAAGGIYGRQIKVLAADDQTNENQGRIQAQKLAAQSVALVGSFTLSDGAIVAPAAAAGVADIGNALQPVRFSSKGNFSPTPNPPGWATGGLAYLKAAYPAASQAVGLLGADLAPTANSGIKGALAKLGMNLVYDQTYSATTTDFTAQVFRMKSQGVRYLIVTGESSISARVLQAANQQGLKLDVFNPIANTYDTKFLQLAGGLAEGTIVSANTVMYVGEDAAVVPEVAAFDTWMRRLDPNAILDVFSIFGWTSCVMFVQAAKAAGPHLTRASLLAQLAKITSFDGNGLLAPANPAGKVPPTCYLMLQVKNGKWQRRDGPNAGFRCDGSYVYP
jgi:ABC-type branched-subunit amino acid transport system substrate-binding protein